MRDLLVVDRMWQAQRKTDERRERRKGLSPVRRLLGRMVNNHTTVICIWMGRYQRNIMTRTGNALQPVCMEF